LWDGIGRSVPHCGHRRKTPALPQNPWLDLGGRFAAEAGAKEERGNERGRGKRKGKGGNGRKDKGKVVPNF